MKPLLRYPEDRGPLAYTLMVLAVQLALFFGPESLWVTALCVVLFQPVQAVAIACNHYQHHINVFRPRGLNRAYEVILFLQTGTPPYLITLHHNLGHHPHYLEPEQDTLRWQRPGGSQPRHLQLGLPHRPPRQAGAALVAPPRAPRPAPRPHPGRAALSFPTGGRGSSV